MDNILLNTWIELENGLKARLTRAAGGSEEILNFSNHNSID